MNNENPNKEYKLKIGENILNWRRLKGMKQEELARKIGISAGALSNIENGASKPDIERIEDIANALNVEVNQLLLHPNQFYSNSSRQADTSFAVSANQQVVDKTMMERMLLLMEKMTDFFTTRKQAD